MRRLLLASLACCAVVACTGNPSSDVHPAEYVGDLEPELVSSMPGATGALADATEEQRAALGALAPAGAAVRVAQIPWTDDRRLAVFLVQPTDRDPFLVADGNHNGSYEATEAAALVPIRAGSSVSEATITLTLDDGPVPSYDLVVGWQDLSKLDIDPEEMPPERLVSNNPVLEGTVDVGGHRIRVSVPYSFATGGVAEGKQSLDADYDGEYDTWFTSRETVYVHDGDPMPIYRVDDRYVSIADVDLQNWSITLADHPAEDYHRIELAVGNELPDFEFTDFDGNRRSLSQFRGKYVLVDVWGTWCGPCRVDVPHHKDAYAAFRERGFEILGLNDEQSDPGDYDEGLAKARAFVEQEQMTWTQATEESVKPLLTEGFMVRAWPMAILLDPDGRILSLNGPGEPPLRFEGLQETLESLIGSN